MPCAAHVHDRCVEQPSLKAVGQSTLSIKKPHFAIGKSARAQSVFLDLVHRSVSAIVSVPAGMSDTPVLRFAVVKVRPAIAWSGAHLLPYAGARVSLSAMSYRHARPRHIAVERSPAYS